MAKDLRTENDNLQAWRNKKVFLTETLLRKSLDELISIKAIINQKTVCSMMQKLSNNEDMQYKAVISPSAISKNIAYKNIMLEAKEKNKRDENTKQKYELNGDKQLEVFQLKTLVAKKESKIKELESIIERANIRTKNTSIAHELNKIDYKSITKDLVNYITKQGIAFIDKNQNLIDEENNNILINSNVIKDF